MWPWVITILSCLIPLAGFEVSLIGRFSGVPRGRMQALNAFNLTNFLLFVPGNGVTTTLGANGSGFGQTAGAYKDLSNTNDPGGRIIEFSLRFNF
jgi:hypothetical protein